MTVLRSEWKLIRGIHINSLYCRGLIVLTWEA